LAKEESNMSHLFCKVGDLAVTVEAELPNNVGNVVKIISAVGYDKFSTYKKIFLWQVEVASAERPLIYEYPDGSIEKCLHGRIPDHYLRPIRPDELEWYEEHSHKLPSPVDSHQEVEYV
jgi:hypothetical protein